MQKTCDPAGVEFDHLLRSWGATAVSTDFFVAISAE